jgi:prepilin-type N-terminal cleavage/methylation domain-containing protein
MKVTKTDQKLNNKGFSLVELIVVISIMAVMVGFVSIGTGILSGKRAKEARDKLLSSLENVRTQTMGKDSIDATLSYDSASGQYILTYVINKDKNAAAEEDEDSGTKVICGSSCIIYYAYGDLSGDVSTA